MNHVLDFNDKQFNLLPRTIKNKHLVLSRNLVRFKSRWLLAHDSRHFTHGTVFFVYIYYSTDIYTCFNARRFTKICGSAIHLDKYSSTHTGSLRTHPATQ